jgi:serine/threonine protein kinase
MKDRVREDVRYRLLHEIGRGGQGVVWLAEDRNEGRKVAVKLLHAETAADARLLRELLDAEAELVLKVCPPDAPHPNIVPICDVRSFGDDVGLVMEYVDGASVYQLLGGRNARNPLPAAQAVEITVQVCEALKTAHSRGVIHRDIKPKEILIQKSDGTPKLADWGVAKNVSIAGPPRTYTGTPPYMPPEVIALGEGSRAEQCRGEGVDHRADLYSLGVTLYEMLTATRPFDGRAEITTGVTAKQAAILQENGVPLELSAIVLRAMAPRPEARFQSAAEFQQALQDWQSASTEPLSGLEAATDQPMCDPPQGDVRYLLLEELWQEGAGDTVWLAEDMLFGGQYAVKLPEPGAIPDDVARSWMVEKASLMARVCPEHSPHPHIIFIRDVRFFGDVPGIVMEYVEGGRVQELLGPRDARRPLPPAEALRITLQVCEALERAHALGVIHRDIKPRNLLIRKSDGVCKVAGWDMGEEIGLAGHSRNFCGTPAYMPPEVIELDRPGQDELSAGTGVDHRGDLYSLGVTLFEMLTATLPFEGLGARKLTGRQAAILQENGVPLELSAIVLRAMAPRPEARFQSAADLEQALRAWIETHGRF